MRRVCCSILLAVLLDTAPVEAVTLRDLIELGRAGIGDDVLVALIELDDTVYALEPRQILELKTAGMSDRVIVALLRNGRRPPPAESIARPDRVGDPTDPILLTIVNTGGSASVDATIAPPLPVPVYVPVFVPVAVRDRPTVTMKERPFDGLPLGFGRFINDGTREIDRSLGYDPYTRGSGALLFGNLRDRPRRATRAPQNP